MPLQMIKWLSFHGWEMVIYCQDHILKFFWTAWPVENAESCYSQVIGFYLRAKAWPFLTQTKDWRSGNYYSTVCAATRKQLQRRTPTTTTCKLGVHKNQGLLNYASDRLGGQASGDSAQVCRESLLSLRVEIYTPGAIEMKTRRKSLEKRAKLIWIHVFFLSPLFQESALIDSSKRELQHLSAQIRAQLSRLRNARDLVEQDWSDKIRAGHLEAECLALSTANCESARLCPSATRLPLQWANKIHCRSAFLVGDWTWTEQSLSLQWHLFRKSCLSKA